MLLSPIPIRYPLRNINNANKANINRLILLNVHRERTPSTYGFTSLNYSPCARRAINASALFLRLSHHDGHVLRASPLKSASSSVVLIEKNFFSRRPTFLFLSQPYTYRIRTVVGTYHTTVRRNAGVICRVYKCHHLGRSTKTIPS